MRRLLLIALLSWISHSIADDPLNALLPEGSQYALLVQRLDQAATSLREHNANLLLPPASTLKLITALAARLILPPDFRFSTRLEQVGRDLVLRFNGDPTLSSDALKQMLSRYHQESGGNLAEDLWIDDSAFNGHERGTGWPWENLGTCYSAPSSAVVIDRNCVAISVSSNDKPGSLVQANVPKHQPLKVTAKARVVTVAEQRERHCNLDLTYSADNSYELNGCWPQSKNPLALELAVQNPALYAQSVVESQLKELGINLKGRVRVGSPPGEPGKTFALQQSPTLTALLDRMLKHSDNLVADNLLKALGGNYFQQPGSYRNGLIALRQVIKEKAGIDLSKAIIEDGSGLSRSNLVSVRQLGQVVRYIYLHDKELNLLGLLPVAGESGTLRFRASINKPPLKGKLKAKTGTLFGTKNLAGVFTTAKGNPLVLIEFITGYFLDDEGKDKGAKPVHLFESRLFNALYLEY